MANIIPDDQFWLAVEASIAAAIEVSQATDGVYPWPPDLMGTPMQPPCLEPFTRFEIEEGSAFLVRMGYFDRPKRLKATKLKGGTE